MSTQIAPVLLLGFLATPILAGPSKPQRTSTPLLLVLDFSDGEHTARSLERELTLVLEEFEIGRREVRRGDFPDRSISDQVARVKRIRRKTGATVVVWLARPLPDVLMLHVVAGRKDDEIIRTVEVQSGTGAEGTLAMAVRELLAADEILASPMEPEVAPKPTPPVEVERALAAQSSSEPTPRLALLLAGEHGFYGGEGPTRAFLCGVGLRRQPLIGRFTVYLSLLGRFGPWETTDESTISANGARLALGLEHPLRIFRDVELIAHVGAQGEWQAITIEPAVGVASDEDYWSARLAFGLEVGFSPWEGWHTGVGLDLGFRPTGVAFRRASDERVLFRSPRWEAGFELILSKSL